MYGSATCGHYVYIWGWCVRCITYIEIRILQFITLFYYTCMVQPVENSPVPGREGPPRMVRSDTGAWVSDTGSLCIYMGLVCTNTYIEIRIVQFITLFLLHLHGATCSKFTRTKTRGASEGGAQGYWCMGQRQGVIMYIYGVGVYPPPPSNPPTDRDGPAETLINAPGRLRPGPPAFCHRGQGFSRPARLSKF